MQGEPKFRRRKTARPAEIVDAAMQVFAERGFAAARLDDIAARAGVSKGSVYLYFATKEDVFRAVVEQAIAPNLAVIEAMLTGHPGPFSALVGAVAERVSQIIDASRIGGVAKMVIGEARNFPELARVWHERLVSRVLDALAQAIALAQARGEVRPGDPRAYALQLIAPVVMAVLWRETFVPVGAPEFDSPSLVRQHAQTLLHGLSFEPPP